MTITKSELLSVLKCVKMRQDATNNSIYVSKDSKRGLSSLDYTDEDKTKLSGIETGAQVNIITNVSADDVDIPDRKLLI